MAYILYGYLQRSCHDKNSISDTVLAVGDVHFQKKCMEKIEEIRKSGKTIVFVSHSLPSVQSLCQKSLLLSGGKMVAIGDTDKIIEQYLKISS